MVSIWALYSPSRLREGTWADKRQDVGEPLIDTLTTYAPNFRRALVDWTLFTPWIWNNGWGSPMATFATSTSSRIRCLRGGHSLAGRSIGRPSPSSVCVAPVHTLVARSPGRRVIMRHRRFLLMYPSGRSHLV